MIWRSLTPKNSFLTCTGTCNFWAFFHGPGTWFFGFGSGFWPLSGAGHRKKSPTHIQTKGTQIRNIAYLDITMTTFYPRHSFSGKKYWLFRDWEQIFTFFQSSVQNFYYRYDIRRDAPDVELILPAIRLLKKPHSVPVPGTGIQLFSFPYLEQSIFWEKYIFKPRLRSRSRLEPLLLERLQSQRHFGMRHSKTTSRIPSL